MAKKSSDTLDKLCDYITYRIIDSTIYLFNSKDDISVNDWNSNLIKLSLLIEDNDINYINLSGKNMEKRKNFYQELGFTLSYYDVNKLNVLYKGVKDKKLYKCYAIMTRNDFLDNFSDIEKNSINKVDVISNDNSGFVSNMLLLFVGIILLCYFCVEGAIYLVR